MKTKEISSGKTQSDPSGTLHLSVVLEEIYSDNFLDSLVHFQVRRVNLEPLPFKVKSMMILITTDNFRPEEARPNSDHS